MNIRLSLILLIFILVSCVEKHTSDNVTVLINQFGNESFRYGNLKTWEPNKSEINFTEKFIPYLDKNNRKIIYVNSLCKDFVQNPIQDLSSKDVEKEIEWKSHYFDVYDGGNCFWQVQVDVDKKEYFDFSVNGF